MTTVNGRPASRPLASGAALGLLVLLASGCSDEGVTDPSHRLADRVQLSESRVLCTSLGEIFTVEATVVDEGGRPVDVGVAWSISDDGIVESLGDARFACRANGSTTVRATALPGGPGAPSGSLPFATVAVTVEQRPVGLGLRTEMIASAPERTLHLWFVGHSRTLQAWSVDALGNPMHLVEDPVTWHSEDESVGSVHAGVVTAEKHGRTTVHAAAGAFEGAIEVDVHALLTLRSCLAGPAGGADGPCTERTMTVAEEGR